MEDNVNHPKHYKGYTAEIECIDITRHMNFQLGNAFKYIWRAGLKGDKAQEQEDYEKARWYLEDFAEQEGPKAHTETGSAVWKLVESQLPLHKREIMSLIMKGRAEEAADRASRTIKALRNSLGVIS